MRDRSRQNGAECRIPTVAHRVLVPTDFSETSRAALAWAVALLNRCDASLHLLHVLEEIVGAEPLEWHLGARSEIERAIKCRIPGIVFEKSRPKRVGHRRGAKWHAGVSAIGLLHRVHRQKPHGINAKLIEIV
jgi:Universal stress protein family